MGLLNEAEEGRHPDLDSPAIRPAVKQVLHCIKMLLTETENLKSKYGLEEVVDVQNVTEPHIRMRLQPSQEHSELCRSNQGAATILRVQGP